MTTCKRPPLFNLRQTTPSGLFPMRPRREGRGQGMVEFAIVLPILLLLIFGLIEFARIFQAWMAVTNSARFGMRYAVTGEYDVNHCADLNGNGLTCEQETDRVTRSQEQDVARLFSIKDVTRGVAIGPVIDDSASQDEPGYFKVTVCSSRPGYTYSPPPDDTCNPQEDPGNPEGGAMRVMVAVTYEHPLILPFLKDMFPSVTLHAERSGILENFRVARVMGLPPVIAIPTMTNAPTDTSTPTLTFTPSPSPTPLPPPTDTPTPTLTPTFTPTPSPTPTRVPSCDDLDVGLLRFSSSNSGKDIELSFQNLNVYPIQFTNLKATWNGQNGWHDEVEYQPYPSDQYFDQFVNRTSGTKVMYDASPNVKLVPGFQVNGTNLNATNSTIPPEASGKMALRFMPRSFTSYYVYYHASDFSLTYSYKVGSLSCGPRTTTGPFGPTVEITTHAPNPITQPFYIQADAADPDPGGSINRVRFEIYDSTGKLVGEQNETKAPYCLFGKSGGHCKSFGVGNTWPNSSNTITNGTYTVYIQARDNDSPRQYTRIKTTIRIAFIPTPTPCPANGRGLLGQYQDYKNPQNGSAPSVNLNKPGLVRLENVNFNWGSGSPGPGVGSDYFVARWSGRVMPLYSEEYTFIVNTDDGVRLWVNGVKLVDEWKDKGSSSLSGEIALQGCRWYDIQMEYFERKNSASARLSWSSSQQREEIIPVKYLDPPNSGVPNTSTPPKPTATPTKKPGPTATKTPLPIRATDTPTPTATMKSVTPTKTPAAPTKTPKPTTPAPNPTATKPPTATQPPQPPPTSTPCPGGGFDC